jgi:hypothetical protein
MRKILVLFLTLISLSSFSQKMKRGYDFTVLENELLNKIRLNDTAILTDIKSLLISEIQQFYWEENKYPITKTYYDGIMFAGTQMQISEFLNLRNKLSNKGFKIYKSDEVLTSKFLDFHYFGYALSKLLDTPRECYIIIPNYEGFEFLEKIDFECGDRAILKTTIDKWRAEFDLEIIWFDKNELLLYFKKLPANIDAFYKEYFSIVGCTFVSESTDEERKTRLKGRFPTLYLNFRSY